MGNDAVSAQGMILFVDIPHDLSITNGIEAVADMPLVLLVKSVAQQCHHRQLQRFLILYILLESLVVLPADQAKNQGTKLLYPVFRKRVQYGLPVQYHCLPLIISHSSLPTALRHWAVPNCFLTCVLQCRHMLCRFHQDRKRCHSKCNSHLLARYAFYLHG